MNGDGSGPDDGIAPDRPGTGSAGSSQAHAPQPSGEDRRWLLEGLRSFALHVEAADLLERRAEASTSPDFAALLRERAARHRRTADRIRKRFVAGAGG
jgi:hypothetical protein